MPTRYNPPDSDILHHVPLKDQLLAANDPKQPYTIQEWKQALLEDKTARKILDRQIEIAPGKLVGARLNLNILKTTGLAIQTLHDGGGVRYKTNHGLFDGLAIGYGPVVILKNAYFNVSQPLRESIASGLKHKQPMASVDGEFIAIQSTDTPEGIEIRFNPKQTHLFIDKDNRAVHSAEEVTIVGHRVYARGKINYHTLDSAPPRAGNFPSCAKLEPTPTNIPPASDQPTTSNVIRPKFDRR